MLVENSGGGGGGGGGGGSANGSVASEVNGGGGGGGGGGHGSGGGGSGGGSVSGVNVGGPGTPVANTTSGKVVLRGTPPSNSNTATSSSSSANSSPAKEHLNGIEAKLANTPPHVLIRSISSLSQHSLRSSTPDSDRDEGVTTVPALKKGVLLQARDRLFSRWKERYFVLTRDYLACFRRGSTKYSEMGSFIFKVNLASVEGVEWQDRRGGPALALSLPREGKVLLKCKAGLDQWYRLLLDATQSSRQRRQALRRGTSTQHLPQATNNNLDANTPFHYSPLGKSGLQYSLSDSTPEIASLCESTCRESSPTSRGGLVQHLTRRNRLSLMADIDISSYDTDMATPPSSVTSSHKFSTSTTASNTSGSGGSSSLASSPSLRGSGPWQRPLSPSRQSGPFPHSRSALADVPRNRFSMYEGPRDPLKEAVSKNRHSICIEPRDLMGDFIKKQKNRHSVCLEPRDLLARNRQSLCLEPRNPLLELMESVEVQQKAKSPEERKKDDFKERSNNKSSRGSPSKCPNKPLPDPPHLLEDRVDKSPSPQLMGFRPRAHSASVTPERSLGPRSRTNIGFFRHSGFFQN
ncbi:uncharacterized protein LOC143020348 isoform X2 [Oratosquilla oratoria]